MFVRSIREVIVRNRYRYVMPAQSHMIGKVGRLQTQMIIPVCAGDSVSVRWHGAHRMAPLVRYMSSDAVLDQFAFYVPHRHAYGQDWIDFVKEGINEAVTFDTVSTNSDVAYLGTPIMNATNLPLWLVHAYNAIWNRYFRVPSDDASLLADDYVATNDTERLYGVLCARLKHLWTTGVDDEIAASTREVAVSGGVFDVIDLAQTRRNLRTEIDRQWFGQYYNDVLENVFGGRANTDADERPTLLARRTSTMSGYDVDGTADATLGSYVGKSINPVGFQVPRKFCPEHGVIMILCLLRFPIVSQHEVHYLARKPQPTYLDISGDPDLWQAEPPREWTTEEYFNQGGAATLGFFPYGQWYRTQPSVIHSDFSVQAGFAFLDVVPGDRDTARYCQNGEYDGVFQTNQFGDWQHHAAVVIDKATMVPGPKSSMYAGVNDV